MPASVVHGGRPVDPWTPTFTTGCYGVIGKVGKALIAAGHRDAAARWVDDATSSGSYDNMLRIALATVRFE